MVVIGVNPKKSITFLNGECFKMFKKILIAGLVLVGVCAFGVEDSYAQIGRAYGQLDSTNIKDGSLSMSADLNAFSSANILGKVSDETGSGVLVFGTSPVFTTSVQIPAATDVTVDATGEIAIDTDVDGDYFDQGLLVYYNATVKMYVPAFSTIGTPADNDVLSYDAANDKWVIEAQTTGTTPGGSTTQIQYNNAGAFGGIAGFTWDATNIVVADDINFAFGTAADWLIQYDEGVDDQLLFITANTAAIATTDPMFEILVGATPTADQQVFGVAKGTQASNTAIFTLDEDGDGVFTGVLSSSNSPTWDAAADTIAAWDNLGYPKATASAFGIASFSTDNFTVTAGDVTVKSGGINSDEIAAQTIVKADIDTTSSFTFLTAFKVNSSVADSAFVTKKYVDGFAGKTSKLLIPIGGLAVSVGTDDALDIYFPLSELYYPWYCKTENSSGSNDLYDTLTVCFFAPADLDSLVFDIETKSTVTTTSSIALEIYSASTFGDATPTSLYSRAAVSSAVADTWIAVSLSGDSLAAVSVGEFVIVQVIGRVDNGQYANFSIIRPYATF